jgi:hypothetical protein
MSRVLNRPLFRRGGSATGITSGLDRPGYNKAGRVDYPRLYDMSEQITEELYPARDSKRDWGRYLMDFGVELAGAEPKGSIFGTAAGALKEPTQRFLARGDIDEKSRGQTKADVFSSLIDAEAKMLSSEAGGKGWLKQWEVEELKNAVNAKYRLDKKGVDNLNDEELKAYRDAEVIIGQLQKDDKLVQNVLGNAKVVDELLQGILESKSREMKPDPKNPGTQVRKYPNTPEGNQEKYTDAIIEVRDIITQAGKAEGGRIGYQDGSMVEDISMQETIEEPMMQPGEPQADAADISYDELRARLPNSINDDIVMLISQSAQALEDFAMIQTQQDVDNFNTKYNVNLVLPQEV